MMTITTGILVGFITVTSVVVLICTILTIKDDKNSYRDR